MQIMGRVTANSLLGKAVSCTIYVVKAEHVQGGAPTNNVRSELSISVATLNGPLCYLSVGLCTFGIMILPRRKSSFPVGFCKLSHC